MTMSLPAMDEDSFAITQSKTVRPLLAFMTLMESLKIED
jgi:hypothetical protein